jgi:multiple sugar transport system permease protein
MESSMKNLFNSKKWQPSRVFALFIFSLLVLVTLIPLWMVLRTALSHPQSLYVHPASFFPVDATLVNFKRVLGFLSQAENMALGGSGAEVNFQSAFLNSLIFTVLVVIGQVFFSAMAAYAFARLKFPGKNLLFGMILGSMMIPGIVLFIPNFVLIKDLGWLNSMKGMVAPFLLLSAFNIFFLRQFFLSIPHDLEEAAMLDGASYAYIFWRIVLPLSTAPLATIGILTGIAAWNEFFWPFLVAKDESAQVLTVALQSFKSQTPQGTPDWTGLMAATFLTVLPTIVLLVVLGRRVVESVQFSGGK